MSAIHSISGATDDDHCGGCARIICVCPPNPCPRCHREMNLMHCDDSEDFVCNGPRGCGYGT